MNQFAECASLAARDWKFEYLVSLCSVIALASMLTPLLALLGLKNGVIDSMRSRLLEDPTTLIITPKSDAGKFSREFIADLGRLPGANYAIGRTRDTSADARLYNPAAEKRASVAFEPATEGEPILKKYHLPAPKNSEIPGLILSQTAAKALGAEAGSKLLIDLGRRNPDGKLESAKVEVKVIGVLPIEAADRRMAFAPLDFMEEMENYRDYIAVPARGWNGTGASSSREYSSFRLYASSLDAVEHLASELEGKQIEVITQAKEIAAIRALEAAINRVILIVSVAVGAGFAAFTVSSAFGAVARKKRTLGMLRLLGFRRAALLCYPFIQTIITTSFGYMISFALYFCVSWGIAYSFAKQGLVCKISLGEAIICFGALILLSLFASLRPALQAADVEPSVALREV